MSNFAVHFSPNFDEKNKRRRHQSRYVLAKDGKKIGFALIIFACFAATLLLSTTFIVKMRMNGGVIICSRSTLYVV